MFSQHFYHQRIRKAVAVFGSLFDNIYIVRPGSTTSSVNQAKVPLSYAPKRNFIERIEQMSRGEDNERQIAIKLPRMSFEIVSIDYDAVRQLQKTLKCSFPGTDNTSKKSVYAQTPYNLSFELNVYAKSQDDALQIVEQIIPYFNPQYTLTVKPIKELPEIKDDVPITLEAVSFTDDYEGPLEQRRTIIYTLSFQMKIAFYGPVNDNAPIIREVRGEVYEQDFALNDSAGPLETLITTPNPLNVSPDSDFTVDTEIYSALDSVPS